MRELDIQLSPAYLRCALLPKRMLTGPIRRYAGTRPLAARSAGTNVVPEGWLGAPPIAASMARSSARDAAKKALVRGLSTVAILRSSPQSRSRQDYAPP